MGEPGLGYEIVRDDFVGPEATKEDMKAFEQEFDAMFLRYKKLYGPEKAGQMMRDWVSAELAKMEGGAEIARINEEEVSSGLKSIAEQNEQRAKEELPEQEKNTF